MESKVFLRDDCIAFCRTCFFEDRAMSESYDSTSNWNPSLGDHGVDVIVIVSSVPGYFAAV